MGLSFCEDDISVQPKKGHYRVDIAPELFLKRNGRGCDDNRLIHAFAVQQHRHKIAKGLANAHASFNRKMLIVYEGVHNLKRHNADVRGVEEVSGKDDDCFNEIVLDELTADF